MYAWLVGEKLVRGLSDDAQEQLSDISGVVCYKPEMVTYAIGQWRDNFSAIHMWMRYNGVYVDNRTFMLYKSDLVKLNTLIAAVLADNSIASKLLPVETSWLAYLFLANQEKYDDAYFNTLKRTRDMITPLIENDVKEFTNFMYYWN
jgi:hypothetical protein